MALTKIPRHRTPLDGSWFRTTANLNSILRAQSLYDDDMTWPKFVDNTTVPVWLSMRKYKAQFKFRRFEDGSRAIRRVKIPVGERRERRLSVGNP